jgi:hypothetical protein
MLEIQYYEYLLLRILRATPKFEQRYCIFMSTLISLPKRNSKCRGKKY